MEPHQPQHQVKAKVAISSKLPDAFKMGTTSNRKHAQHHDPSSHLKNKKQGEIKVTQNKQNQKTKGSKNPFRPIQQYKKQLEQFQKLMELEMRGISQDMERVTKQYNIDGGSNNKIKYENCITLSYLRKNSTGCLKKVLHVPTLTVYFMKETVISSQINKDDLQEWINLNNKMGSECCIKIMELFWSMPEDSYTLIYEYSEGVFVDSLLDSLHTLPLGIVQEIVKAHLDSLGMFNSQLILHQEGSKTIIKYLPIYEEIEFLIGDCQKIKEIMESSMSQFGNNSDQNLLYRLGVTVLVSLLGSDIFYEDISHIDSVKKCCLYHQLMQNQSLTKIFLEMNGLQDEGIEDFLCMTLKSRKHFEPGINLRLLKKSQFLSKKYNSIVSLEQIISMVDPCSKIKSKFQISKMNKIMDSVGLILQNVSDKTELPINQQNKGIYYLAKELGMPNEVEKIIRELKKVYKNQKG